MDPVYTLCHQGSVTLAVFLCGLYSPSDSSHVVVSKGDLHSCQLIIHPFSNLSENSIPIFPPNPELTLTWPNLSPKYPPPKARRIECWQENCTHHETKGLCGQVNPTKAHGLSVEESGPQRKIKVVLSERGVWMLGRKNNTCFPQWVSSTLLCPKSHSSF